MKKILSDLIDSFRMNEVGFSSRKIYEYDVTPAPPTVTGASTITGISTITF
jgi:hypothetical protein